MYELSQLYNKISSAVAILKCPNIGKNYENEILQVKAVYTLTKFINVIFFY